MAQRTVALCNGKYIGIESIYTVIDGRQINIPEKLKELRTKSRNSELFCPCGCGANLILVAGDKNLREQHFRIKDGEFNQECHMITEGKTSVDSKIVLKCWLDDKLCAADIESRVPICAVDDVNRKYEFTFLSREKGIALTYCHGRANLSDEKLSILERNGQGIHIIHIVDSMNGSSDGQYPEGLMKVQDRQGYCLLLSVKGNDYSRAEMKAVFYARDIDGLWREVSFAENFLKNFNIDNDGLIFVGGESLSSKLIKAQSDFASGIEREKSRREERRKQQEEAEKEWKRRAAEYEEKERRRRAAGEAERKEKLDERLRLEEIKAQEEERQREEDVARIRRTDFIQQKEQIIGSDGKRWVKCKICGKIDKTGEFTTYGGKDEINLGICKECYPNYEISVPGIRGEEQKAAIKKKYEPDICPECGGKLRERNGKYGKFYGCSNYPNCKYTRR